MAPPPSAPPPPRTLKPLPPSPPPLPLPTPLHSLPPPPPLPRLQTTRSSRPRCRSSQRSPTRRLTSLPPPRRSGLATWTRLWTRSPWRTCRGAKKVFSTVCCHAEAPRKRPRPSRRPPKTWTWTGSCSTRRRARGRGNAKNRRRPAACSCRIRPTCRPTTVLRSTTTASRRRRRWPRTFSSRTRSRRSNTRSVSDRPPRTTKPRPAATAGRRPSRSRRRRTACPAPPWTSRPIRRRLLRRRCRRRTNGIGVIVRATRNIRPAANTNNTCDRCPPRVRQNCTTARAAPRPTWWCGGRSATTTNSNPNC